MRKRNLLLATTFVFISGCSALTLQQATESIKSKRDTSEKNETKIIETGSPPLVSKSTTISVKSEGPVNIHTPEEQGSGGQLLNAELLKALAEIRNHRNTDQTSVFKESVEVEFYRKMSVIGGLLFILVAIGCLLMVRAMKLLRLESTRWGFDPKTVGRSAHKMVKMLEGVDDMLTRESSSLVNKLTSNGLEEETKGQIERQIIRLGEIKKVVEKVDNSQRTPSGHN